MSNLFFFSLKGGGSWGDQREWGGEGASSRDVDLAPCLTGQHRDHYSLGAALSTG